MQTEAITVDREEARQLFRKYQEHRHYSTPVDLEILRVYEAIAKGKLVIRALASIATAGLGPDNLPKLAIVRADAPECHVYLRENGGARFSMNAWARDAHRHTYIDLPTDSFPRRSAKWGRHFAAMTPLVPIHLRPKPRQGNPQGALANYHILFEAEWRPVPPKDPLLLRRVGQADLWVVLAAWDLTEVERAVLAGRL